MKINILENIVVFILDIRMWSGRKKLQAEDLAANGIDPDKLPPGTLASLGSKKIISTEALAPFSAIKREAEKLCLAHGVRFLGGYAVPTHKAQMLKDQLSVLQQRFESNRTELLENYERKINTWIAQNPPEWAQVIETAVDPVSKVQRSLTFSCTPVQIKAPEEIKEPRDLEEQTEGLYAQLCREVRGMANAAYTNSYSARRDVTRKALRPVVAIREKLLALEFLSPEIPQLVHKINACLNRIPPKGPIQGYELDMLKNLLHYDLAHMHLPANKASASQSPDTKRAEKSSTHSEQASAVPFPTPGGMHKGPATEPMSIAWDF